MECRWVKKSPPKLHEAGEKISICSGGTVNFQNPDFAANGRVSGPLDASLHLQRQPTRYHETKRCAQRRESLVPKESPHLKARMWDGKKQNKANLALEAVSVPPEADPARSCGTLSECVPVALWPPVGR